MVNEIIHADCLTGMNGLPSDHVDLTVTSPPYDGLRTYNGYSFDFESIAKELYRVTKSGGVVVWVVADATVGGSETGTSFRQALFFKEVGFNLHDTMIYLKNGGIPLNSNRYEPGFEYMFVLSKGKPKTFNPLMTVCKDAGRTVLLTQRQENGEMKRGTGNGKPVKEEKVKSNAWLIDAGYMRTTADDYAYDHPAMFPEKLAEDHIISWSNPGDLVMDIFTGSGTTAKMAIAHGRKFIGFEISEKYVEIAKRRIENVQPVMNF